MRDNKSVAFELYLGKKKKKNGNYRTPFITIWHHDPEKDGTDDSCGWNIRTRHMDAELIEQTIKEFESEWDSIFLSADTHVYNTGWFNPQGVNVLSVRGIVLNMYIYAAKIVLNPKDKYSAGKMWDIAFNFVQKNYVKIMYFAENNRDSIFDTITRKFQIACNVEYTPEKRQEMIKECAHIVCAHIANLNRKWYQHPRWHVHHWSIRFNLINRLYRRYFELCSVCGKRGYKGAAMTNWEGTETWHEECDKNFSKIPQEPPACA